MTFIGDATHNLVDGVLIAASFLADPSVGVLTLVAVGLHELPREVVFCCFGGSDADLYCRGLGQLT